MRREFAEAEHKSAPLDAAVFLAAAVLGLLAYWLLRMLLHERAQVPITVVLIVIMLAYSAAVALLPRIRLRLDQAGDNAYYIGLLFTLTSMAFALWDFRLATGTVRSAAGVQQIISNFGIALATTIIGILLRVALHQMRVDPADLEEMTRVELTEAAERLRGILDTTTSDLARFHLEVQQKQMDVFGTMAERFSEAASQVQKSVADSSARVVAQTEDSYKSMLDGTHQLTVQLKALAIEATGAIERLKAVQPPPLTLSRRLDKVGEIMERVANESERTATGLKATLAGATQAIVSVKETAELLRSLTAGIRDEHVTVITNVNQAAENLTAGLESFNIRLGNILVDVTELQGHLKDSATESMRAQKATTDVINSLTLIAREMTTVIKASDPHVMG